MTEIWKTMDLLHLSKYSCSSLGRIKNNTSKTLVKQRLNHDGYQTIVFTNDLKKKTTYLIHRLILQTFNNIILDKNTQVDHIDRNRANNCLDNLRAVTPSENMNNRITYISKADRQGRNVIQLNPITYEIIQEFNNISSAIDGLKLLSTSEKTAYSEIAAACKMSKKYITNGDGIYEEYCNFCWVYPEDHHGDLPNELWKQKIVNGIELQVSDQGRIKFVNGAVKRGKVRTRDKSDNSYRKIWIGDKQYNVHIIVIATFIKKPQGSNIVVDHINEIKSDNRLENLRWLTQKENVEHSGAVGVTRYLKNSDESPTIYVSIKEAMQAMNHKRSHKIVGWCESDEPDLDGFHWKFNDVRIKKYSKGRLIGVYDKSGNLTATYNSIKEAAEMTNTTTSIVTKMCSGKTKNLDLHDYTYKYADVLSE